MAISKAGNHTKTNATNITLISGVVSFLTKETRLATFLQISSLQRTPINSAKSKYSQGFSVLLGNRSCFAMISFAKHYFKNSIKSKTCIYSICTFGQPLRCTIRRPSSNAKIVMMYTVYTFPVSKWLNSILHWHLKILIILTNVHFNFIAMG